MWLTEKFDEKDIHIDLGSDQTSYIIRTQEDIIQLTFFENAMMAENPYYSKRRYRNITPSHHRYQ
jgi:deoxycytidine triphosphate deaminase